MERMRAEAAQVGGDGVVAVRLTVAPFEGIGTEFRAIGTAVRADGDVHPARPFTSDLSGQEFAQLIAAGWVPAALLLGIAVMVRHDDWRSQPGSWSVDQPGGRRLHRRHRRGPVGSPQPARRRHRPVRRRRHRRRPGHEPADPPALLRGRQRRARPRRRGDGGRHRDRPVPAPGRERPGSATARAAPLREDTVTDPAAVGLPQDAMTRLAELQPGRRAASSPRTSR
jgi:hypothetical protein